MTIKAADRLWFQLYKERKDTDLNVLTRVKQPGVCKI